MGVHRQALLGLWTQPQIPLGYRRVKGKRLKIIDAEADVVRRVFSEYLARESFAETALALRSAGLTNRGKEWTSERVRQTLENPIYAGRLVSGGVEKDLPELAIIPPAAFAEIAARRERAPRRGKPASEAAREAMIENVFGQYLDSLRDMPDLEGSGSS
jgi:hypothetical protein